MKVDELQKQNQVVHEQLESLSGGVTAMTTEAAGTEAGGASSSISAGQGGGMAEVVKYLRSEKARADAELLVKRAEASRLEAALHQTQRALDEARLALDAERKNSGTRDTRSEEEHAALMQKVSDMNLLMESNRTLRADAESERDTAKLILASTAAF